MNFATSIFNFFSSLKLGVTLLVISAIIFAVGTFIESYHGARAAQLVIYNTLWFSSLLVLLAFNLLASAIDRMPWKKKHIGFLTTHLGIILILVGSLITKTFAIEGQLVIEEGQTGSRMMLTDPIIHVAEVQSARTWTFALNEKPFPWEGRELLTSKVKAPFDIAVVANYPKARIREEIRESESGLPAIHVSLKGSMASIEEWLIMGDPSRSQLALGPATLRFTDEFIEKQKKKKNMSEWGNVIFDFENGKKAVIEVDQQKIGKSLPLHETPYEVQIEKIFRNAVVIENELKDQTSEWRNPAVQLTLKGDGLSEHHIIFALYPEFPTLHGLGESEARVRIAYEAPNTSNVSLENELRFVYKSDGLPEYQTKRGDVVKRGQVTIGESVETGWMDFKFVVNDYHPTAHVEQVFDPLSGSSQLIEALPVVALKLEAGDELKHLWLPQGEAMLISIGGSDYHLVYGVRTRPLGYQLKLRDFIIEKNPGTQSPASFKSEVTLKDVGRGVNRDLVIQMNEPLKHRGFKVYQSGYQQEPGQPEISIFSVAKDPGNGLKYLGTIVMVSGIMMLFYVSPLSTLKSSDPKLRKR
jgi:hypothetical protein